MNESAKLLKATREKKVLTQTEMADLIADGLGQSYSLRQYQRLESGEFPKFKSEVIKEVDKILGLNLYDKIYDKKVSRGALKGKSKSYNTEANREGHPNGRTINGHTIKEFTKSFPALVNLLTEHQQERKRLDQTIFSQQETIKILVEREQPPDIGKVKKA